MSSADIKNSSLDRITQAATEVFTAEGYDVIKQGPGGMVFERPATRKKEIAYGGVVGGGIIEQVVLGFQERNPKLVWVSCDAYMIKGRGGDPFFEEKDAVLRAFGGSYRKLLKKVKAQAEKEPVNVVNELETETK